MIIALTGPSGIGKGCIKRQLLQTYPFIEELAWFTTRPLRPNESDGNRINVPETQFEQLVELGHLILVQNLYGHRYGLRKHDLIPHPNVRLTELHIDNLKEALRINPLIIVIGLITGDISFLRERLSVNRNTASPAEIEQRIAAGAYEIVAMLRERLWFTSIIEVSRGSEGAVLNQVIEVLSPHLE